MEIKMNEVQENLRKAMLKKKLVCFIKTALYNILH